MVVPIEFVGVWDTVDSVGFVPKRVPFTKYNHCVKTFRHALALDEHRVKFKANLYDKVITTQAGSYDVTYTPLSQHGRNIKKKAIEFFNYILSFFKNVVEEGETLRYDAYNKGSSLQDRYTDTSRKTDVLEVWFAGCHTDVGGGAVRNDTPNSLARIPLRWMIRQCFLSNSGIQFEAEKLRTIGLDPKSLYPVVKPRPPPLPVPDELACDETGEVLHCGSCKLHPSPSDLDRTFASEFSDDATLAGADVDRERDEEHDLLEEHADLHDALSPIYDMLMVKWWWWILEFIPLVHLVQKPDGTNVKVISINRGRPRVVTTQDKKPLLVHRAVKTRMEAESHMKNYRPRLKFDVEPIWVD